MKTSIVYPNAEKNDIALGFNCQTDYNFIFKGKDKENIQNLVEFIQKEGFEAYISGVLAEEIPRYNTVYSENQYPPTIILGAVGKNPSELSDKIYSLLDDENKSTSLSKELLGRNFRNVYPTIRSRIGENIPIYNFLFSWDWNTGSNVSLGIYDKLI